MKTKQKKCTKCLEEKESSLFAKDSSSKDLLKSWCKNCSNLNRKEYRVKNIEKEKKKDSDWFKNNKEKKYIRMNRSYKAMTEEKKNKFREKQKSYYLKNYKEIKETQKVWDLNNKEKLTLYRREYVRNRHQNDINFRLRRNLQKRVYDALKGNPKPDATINLIGCSIEFLKQHLESKFQPGMSWENYGKWHIDHIYPLSKVDLSDGAIAKKAFHYSNLQPLWAIDNIKKSDTIVGEVING